MSETIHEPTTKAPLVDTESGDHDRFAHYVSPKSALNEALVMGTPVTAICGKTWVPSRDPDRYPICPDCNEIKAAIDAHYGG